MLGWVGLCVGWVGLGLGMSQVHAQWAPDGRHILTTAEFNIHITIWSLTSQTVYYIENPKDPVNGVSFAHDGKYMAVARRKACKDFIAVYSCESWELVKEFQVDTQDLVEIQWSPDDRCGVVLLRHPSYRSRASLPSSP